MRWHAYSHALNSIEEEVREQTSVLRREQYCSCSGRWAKLGGPVALESRINFGLGLGCIHCIQHSRNGSGEEQDLSTRPRPRRRMMTMMLLQMGSLSGSREHLNKCPPLNLCSHMSAPADHIMKFPCTNGDGGRTFCKSAAR